jgi:DNA-binding CsgD family transcriptional regulator
MHQAVPDLHVELIDVVTHGEFVSVEWRFTGTHEAPLFGIPPSGQAIEERGFTKIRVRGDEIIEGRDYWNLGAMLDRLSRPSAAQVAREHSLTPRQAEVALLLADGASAKRIARALRIAVNTARRHTQAVLRRLGVHDRREVAHRIGRASIAVSGPHSPTSSDTSKPGTECDRD